MTVRTIACLPALVGAWRDEGGGLQLSTSGAFRFNRAVLERPDLLGDRQPRTINMIRLGDALSLDPARLARAHYRPRPIDLPVSPEEAGPPVKVLIVYNSNPAAVAPNQQAVLDGLRREDLLTVVLEHFQTDTADYKKSCANLWKPKPTPRLKESRGRVCCVMGGHDSICRNRFCPLLMGIFPHQVANANCTANAWRLMDTTPCQRGPHRQHGGRRMRKLPGGKDGFSAFRRQRIPS